MDNATARRPGRPAGATSLMTRKAREQAMATGLLPHEILLDMARGNPQKVQKVETLKNGDVRITEEWVCLDVSEQKDAAKAAAPYYAPKLSNVETTQGIADDDLDSLIKQLAAQAGVALTAGGEDEEDAAPTQPAGAGRSARRRIALDD